VARLRDRTLTLFPVGGLVHKVGRGVVMAVPIDEDFAWLHGVHRSLLQDLPLWPGRHHG